MRIADDKVKQQFGGLNPKSFTHVEYFVPRTFGQCSWGGLGNVGCARPGEAQRPGACFTVIRDAFPTTRMHELGHNLVSLKDDQFCLKKHRQQRPHICKAPASP